MGFKSIFLASTFSNKFRQPLMPDPALQPPRNKMYSICGFNPRFSQIDQTLGEMLDHVLKTNISSAI